jgi:hypothetical protein
VYVCVCVCVAEGAVKHPTKALACFALCVCVLVNALKANMTWQERSSCAKKKVKKRSTVALVQRRMKEISSSTFLVFAAVTVTVVQCMTQSSIIAVATV